MLLHSLYLDRTVRPYTILCMTAEKDFFFNLSCSIFPYLIICGVNIHGRGPACVDSLSRNLREFSGNSGIARFTVL